MGVRKIMKEVLKAKPGKREIYIFVEIMIIGIIATMWFYYSIRGEAVKPEEWLSSEHVTLYNAIVGLILALSVLIRSVLVYLYPKRVIYDLIPSFMFSISIIIYFCIVLDRAT